MEGETLEAGRALDERIAIEVMGWRYPRVDGVVMRPRPWSTDRTRALEVVDRLTEAGLGVQMTVWWGALATVRVGVPGEEEDLADVTAPSLALAIARAALSESVLMALRSREGGAVTNP